MEAQSNIQWNGRYYMNVGNLYNLMCYSLLTQI